MIGSIMAGSLLGGLESVYGAIIGGMIIGMAEILITLGGSQTFGTWFGEYRPLIPMVFLVIVLLIEPGGLFGFYQKLTRPRRKQSNDQ
jgi:branched-chain amino acid transport system permease protein